MKHKPEDVIFKACAMALTISVTVWLVKEIWLSILGVV